MTYLEGDPLQEKDLIRAMAGEAKVNEITFVAS